MGQVHALLLLLPAPALIHIHAHKGLAVGAHVHGMALEDHAVVRKVVKLVKTLIW